MIESRDFVIQADEVSHVHVVIALPQRAEAKAGTIEDFVFRLHWDAGNATSLSRIAHRPHKRGGQPCRRRVRSVCTRMHCGAGILPVVPPFCRHGVDRTTGSSQKDPRNLSRVPGRQLCPAREGGVFGKYNVNRCTNTCLRLGRGRSEPRGRGRVPPLRSIPSLRPEWRTSLRCRATSPWIATSSNRDTTQQSHI